MLLQLETTMQSNVYRYIAIILQCSPDMACTQYIVLGYIVTRWNLGVNLNWKESMCGCIWIRSQVHIQSYAYIALDKALWLIWQIICSVDMIIEAGIGMKKMAYSVWFNNNIHSGSWTCLKVRRNNNLARDIFIVKTSSMCNQKVFTEASASNAPVFHFLWIYILTDHRGWFWVLHGCKEAFNIISLINTGSHAGLLPKLSKYLLISEKILQKFKDFIIFGIIILSFLSTKYN